MLFQRKIIASKDGSMVWYAQILSQMYGYICIRTSHWHFTVLLILLWYEFNKKSDMVHFALNFKANKF